MIEVKDHRTVFVLKYRRGRKHPFQSPKKSSVSPDALAKLCRITSCFPVAFPVVSVKLEDSKLEGISKERLEAILKDRNHPEYKNYFNYAIDKRLVRWGQLQNRELPKEPPPDGYQLHYVDGGVLDNRPFSYTIREIYYRAAYRPVERKLFYIDPSPDQFLGSSKFNRMAKPNIWETISDSLVAMPRYESISNDLQEIKDRNERVLRYKFLRATAERVGEEKLEQLKEDQQPSPDEIRRQQIYLRCRLVGMRDRILPLILRIDKASVPNPNSPNQNERQNQDKPALLESVAQLITKYITYPEKQKEWESFLHNLGKEIRNLDVEYALKKHFFLLAKMCQFMSNTQYQDKEKYPNLHQSLKRLGKNLSRQVELLEVLQTALEEMLQSDQVSRTFYALIEQAKKGMLPSKEEEPQSKLTHESGDIRNDLRQHIYDYLLRLHRFLLDADGLTNFDPNCNHLERSDNPYSLDEPDDKENQPEKIPADFFKPLHVPISTAQISGVLLQLKEKTNQLNFAKLGLTIADGEDDRLDLKQQGSIWKDDKYEYKGHENDTDAYDSILHQVEIASEKLIKDSIKSANSEEQASELPNCSSNIASVYESLLKSFQSFRYVDEEVYSYEYLSDIQAKEQIEIVRISPDVAQFGYGKGKGLEEKLAGNQLGAFGGFFKKSWRSNDILWGRLDGLNRIVEALLTSSALKNFSSFLSRQLGDMEPGEKRQKYLNKLVDEALPEATESERASIIQDLEKLAVPGQTLEGKALTCFLDRIVTVGHRAIIKTDLGNVLEDAITEQLDWNQQLIGSKKSFKETVSSLGYKSPFAGADERVTQHFPSINNHPPSASDQRWAVQQVDRLIAGVLSPGSKNAQNWNKDILEAWLKTAFFQCTKEDREKLIEYPLKVAASSTASVDELYTFLKRLLTAGHCEIKRAGIDPAVVDDIKKLNQTLEQMLQKLNPKYEPVAGYFAPAVTPFAVKELAASSIKALLADPHQAEDYFRNIYRVGSETITQDIPSVILEDLAARTGLVLRDIVNSPPTGNRARETTTFQVANRLLQAYYVWVQAKRTGTSLLPQALKAWGSLLLLVAAIASVAFLVSKLPVWLLVLLITLVVLQFLNKVFNRRKSFAWMPWIVASTLVVLIITGLHFLPDGTSTIKTPFGEIRIFIQNQ